MNKNQNSALKLFELIKILGPYSLNIKASFSQFLKSYIEIRGPFEFIYMSEEYKFKWSFYFDIWL